MDALDLLRQGTVIPAMPLALNAERKLDERRQRALVRYYAAAGAGGLAVGVHTTQFAIRDPKIDMFERVLAVAAEALREQENHTGRTLVKVAGACGETAQAVKEARFARACGYDAVLLSPGGLPNLTENELIERTRTVAGTLPVIGFYLQPGVGGRAFTAEYWKQLAGIPGVVAIKAAPFHRYQTLDVVRAVALSPRAKEIALYTGNDDNIVVDLLTPFRFAVDGQTFETRFIGGLLGHWAVWTRVACQLFERVLAVRGAECIPADLLALNAQVTDANGAFFDVKNGFRGCIAGIHEVLRRQGLLEGIWCLDEGESLSPGQAGEIDRVYAMYPHLNDDVFVRDNLCAFLNS